MDINTAKKIFETADYQPWALVAEARKVLLRLIYRWTHSDFKGRAGERWGVPDRGKPTILVNRGGTCLVLLENLTDEEINNKLPYALKKDAERKAKAAAAMEAA